jgi:hypothetical protein
MILSSVISDADAHDFQNEDAPRNKKDAAVTPRLADERLRRL